jgi:hypothetical protein
MSQDLTSWRTVNTQDPNIGFGMSLSLYRSFIFLIFPVGADLTLSTLRQSTSWMMSVLLQAHFLEEVMATMMTKMLSR